MLEEKKQYSKLIYFHRPEREKKIYAVLLHFSKCFNLRVKSAPRLLKIEGGVSPIQAMPVFRPLFLKELPLVVKLDWVAPW